MAKPKSTNKPASEFAQNEIKSCLEVDNSISLDCLRHTTGGLLAAAGVYTKTAQSLMRHGDIDLIMARYNHIFRGQESEAIEKLPDL
jgi:integrase